MRLEDLTLAIRPRGRLESIDVGFALARANWRRLVRIGAFTILPCLALFSALAFWKVWLAWLLIWWFKPLYDRILLWVLSRAVFGAEVSAESLRVALPDLVWNTQLFRDLTYRRFSVQRSFDLPVAQLEGQRGSARRDRLRHLHRGVLYAAQGLTVAAANLELALYLALYGLIVMLLPPEAELDVAELYFGAVTPLWFDLLGNAFYAFAICIIEPFYVAGGFALYLNRRTWLEGWDLELAFRRMALHERPASAALPATEVA